MRFFPWRTRNIKVNNSTLSNKIYDTQQKLLFVKINIYRRWASGGNRSSIWEEDH